MHNQYYSSDSDNQDVEGIANFTQEEYAPTRPLFPLLPDTSEYLEKTDAAIVSTPKSKQGTIPRADIIGTEIAEKYRGKWIFNGEANCWMIYEFTQPGIWTKVNDICIEGLINKELKNQEIAGYGSCSYITNIISKIRIELIEMSWQERLPTKLLPFENCVLEIATGNVLKHSPEYRFTWCLPRAFDNSSNEFRLIDKWLDEVTSTNQSIKIILLCYLAAILKGRSDLQQFLHLIGSGGTGKGTFFRLAQSLVGNYNVCSTTLRDFCSKTFGVANAYKKRLLLFPDQTPYQGDVQKFKSLTGQDELQAEEKYKQPFQFRFDGMVIMVSNDPVFDTRNSSWLTRRQILIPFTNTIDKKKCRNLEEEFQPELNALTQYLLSISDETVTEVLRCATDNPELAQHSLEQQISTNSIAGWIDECVIRDGTSKCAIGSDKTDSKTLFGSYTQWCRKSGSSAPTLRTFSLNLLDFCNSTMRWDDVKKLRNSQGYYIDSLRLRQLGNDDHLPSPLVSVESTYTVKSEV
ncbi:phage/plasmid primase, P4 family [Nostoc sp. XA010]|uniref:DNA primase family protein n=1 Tax=Nostoc sp. XA010 TaxID=2780407 RepID=UPI001E4F9EF7|nr:phage/plasmid primase, P4 family [Nostoc sp. XA010]MCC5660684.1 phage/plasmid primase, P4 family [Nostoc sp. XA010]